NSVNILRSLIRNRSSRQRWMRAVFVVLSVLSLSAFAQNSSPTTITVTGIVRNPSGVPVVDASVMLQDGQASPILTKTNGDGRFTLSAAHTGTYTLKVKKTGWRDSVKDNLVLSAAKIEVNL